MRIPNVVVGEWLVVMGEWLLDTCYWLMCIKLLQNGCAASYVKEKLWAS
ncbi:MAG: hypothetical protein KBD43_15035 [Saprospiraceae bacterium]|nr:hypothetical protein [Saprospiraceae bacterium]